ncbi:MAG TPA: ATP-dependent metalloprotease, partial [Shewanella frigidimarina]|nr:ATP-dependent metalloprotease [Shewanella frigidimarina]
MLTDNMDILHAMKDALMKYETIDSLQIDDLMNRREVRMPAEWQKDESSDDKDNGNTTPKSEVETPVDEAKTDTKVDNKA